MTAKKKAILTPTFITFIALSLLAVLAGFIGLFAIYQNNKTDGFNSGEITVANCQETDWNRKIYSCTGDYFSTGGGMIERSNVSVTVFAHEYTAGDIITDVYPPTFSDKQATHYFITGRERTSVTYNLPWLFAIFLGILLPIITALLRIVIRNNKRTASPSCK